MLQGSPALTDARGTRDLVQPDDLRIYYFAGTQHFTRPPAWDPSATAYPAGVRSEFDEILRALWVRLEAWMVEGTPPPASRVPRLADGTLVRPEDLRYPAMRGVSFPVGGADRPVPEFRYRGWYNGLGLLDFGPRFDEADESGIADWLPPAYLGKDYAILVSAVDGDGNEAAGVQPVGNRAPARDESPVQLRRRPRGPRPGRAARGIHPVPPDEGRADRGRRRPPVARGALSAPMPATWPRSGMRPMPSSGRGSSCPTTATASSPRAEASDVLR